MSPFTNTLRILALAAVFLSDPGAHAAVPGAVPIDQGWRLWLDPKAAWRDDVLFLPDEVKLNSLPVNPPSGGWEILNGQAGIEVSLPATVEQFYFNRPPARTAGSSTPADVVAADGFYQGVSWWYRPFVPPALQPGERLIFHFPAGRLRCEVYVNGKLTGYTIISEAPFTADATHAIIPGATNQLAVRVTNPGGRLDWMDFLTMRWGHYTLPATHAFGGLAGGVEMQVRSPVHITDLAVLNTPDPRSVHLLAEITSTGPGYEGPVDFSIGRDGQVVFKESRNVHVPPGGTVTAALDAAVPAARLWDIDQPNLYRASAGLPAAPHSGRTTDFGFRWFEVKGLGSDAKLYLNSRRVVPRSSISWGFWAPNGIFPDAAAAGREIAAMKELGLNSLQNHRHMPKEVVLDAFDRTGFLRYCEAGCGVLVFEPAQSEPPGTGRSVEWNGRTVELDFMNRYQLAKELAMIHAFRSHPCVSLWTLQNETSPEVNNPRMRYALEQMRQADPSRPVLLKSGEGINNQVWCLPYSETWMTDDGSGRSGWWDQHTAMDSPGVWVDAMYKSPGDFKYRSGNRGEVVVWGEMATGASPDNHAAMVRWYETNHLTGYDLAAHQAILAAYNRFLDEHRFRSAFPTAEAIFLQAGAKHYFSAARLLENARMCDAVDYIVLSGWESTTIDDHSGLVDSLRGLKADPALLRQAGETEVLVVRPRRSVIAPGDTSVVDVHQINERNLSGAWRLSVTASMKGRGPVFHADYPVELAGGETFGQLLKEGVQFKPEEPGLFNIHAELRPAAAAEPVFQRDEPLLVVDPHPVVLKGPVACAGESAELIAAIRREFNADAVPLSPGLGRMPAILLATSSGGPEGWQPSFMDAPVANTDEPELYKNQLWGQATSIHTWYGLKPGKVTVKLHLDDGYMGGPRQRLFDVAINGTVVVRDLDIVAEAGGKNRALVKTYIVEAPDGSLRLSIPRVTADNASIAAVELSDESGKTIRAVFRDQPYTDHAGNVWTPISRQNDDHWKPDLDAALDRARNDGSRVVLLTTGSGDAEQMAAILASRGLVKYSGPVGSSGPSWMGFWFFGRKHWLLDGLPSDCVLDWPYQVTTGNGLMLSGPGLETVVGYGRNHDPNLGVATAVIPCGKGQVVLLALPGLMNSFVEGAGAKFQPVTAKRILFNALNH
ncbi:MAG: malectin domain-containing carbohydrate-binding protein [Verrucomicrobiota bacterium]